MFDSQGLDLWKRTAGRWRESYILLMLCSTHKASTMREELAIQELLKAAKLSIKAVTIAEQEEAFWATWKAVQYVEPTYMISLEEWLHRMRGK